MIISWLFSQIQKLKTKAQYKVQQQHSTVFNIKSKQSGTTSFPTRAQHEIHPQMARVFFMSRLRKWQQWFRNNYNKETNDMKYAHELQLHTDIMLGQN